MKAHNNSLFCGTLMFLVTGTLLFSGQWSQVEAVQKIYDPLNPTEEIEPLVNESQPEKKAPTNLPKESQKNQEVHPVKEKKNSSSKIEGKSLDSKLKKIYIDNNFFTEEVTHVVQASGELFPDSSGGNKKSAQDLVAVCYALSGISIYGRMQTQKLMDLE